MREGIYEIQIMHARAKPVKQGFTIRGYSPFVDVARFDAASSELRFLGFGKRRLHNFRKQDFSLIADPALNAVESAKSFLELGTGIKADQVFLLANPGILGYVFNPVSFFFYYSKNAHVATVVEVNNTFAEQKHFIVPAGPATVTAKKDFYVSPFISPDSNFQMRIVDPSETLSIGIHTRNETELELAAEMRGDYHPLTDGQLLKMFGKYPLHTLRVIVLIHWFALKLFWKKVPFYPKQTSDAAIIHHNLRSLP